MSALDETPAPLVRLRGKVAASTGWRYRGKVLSGEERAALTDVQRLECRWAADPRLVEQLSEYERAYTDSFSQ